MRHTPTRNLAENPPPPRAQQLSSNLQSLGQLLEFWQLLQHCPYFGNTLQNSNDISFILCNLNEIYTGNGSVSSQLGFNVLVCDWSLKLTNYDHDDGGGGGDDDDEYNGDDDDEASADIAGNNNVGYDGYYYSPIRVSSYCLAHIEGKGYIYRAASGLLSSLVRKPIGRQFNSPIFLGVVMTLQPLNPRNELPQQMFRIVCLLSYMLMIAHKTHLWSAQRASLVPGFQSNICGLLCLFLRLLFICNR